MINELVAITGQKGSGKNAVSAIFADEWAFEEVMFAGTLKGMIKFLLVSAGLTDDEAEQRVNGSQAMKEEALDVLLGQSTRFAMQRLGTEFRDFFGPTLWTDIVKSKIAVTPRAILTDMRFLHEADYVDEQRGAKVRVKRAGQAKSADLHISEQEMEKIIVDFTIYNHGTLDDLHIAALMVGMTVMSDHSLDWIATNWSNH